MEVPKTAMVVVSSLVPIGKILEDQHVRASDRIVLNAPDLDVQYINVGECPEGDWNN